MPVHHLRGHIAACYTIWHNPAGTCRFWRLSSQADTAILSGWTIIPDYHRSRPHARRRGGRGIRQGCARIAGRGRIRAAPLYRQSLPSSGDPKAYRLPVPHVDGAPYRLQLFRAEDGMCSTFVHSAQAGRERTFRPPTWPPRSMQRCVKTLLDKLYACGREYGASHLSPLAGGVSGKFPLRRKYVRRAQALQGRAHIACRCRCAGTTPP